MRLWSRSTTRLMLALPVSGMMAGVALTDPISVAAQAVTSTDVIGTWVSGPQWQLPYPDPDSLGSMETLWTYGADSTVHNHPRWKGVEDTTRGEVRHWTLHGDTLIAFFQASDTLPKPPRGSSFPNRARIARQGDRLVVGVGSACADTMRRVDTSKPLPPPVKPPITVDPSAVAGTWVANWKTARPRGGDSVAKSDTLRLRADKTVRFSSGANGMWELYPSDILGIQESPRSNGQRPTVVGWQFATVQGQLILTVNGYLCSPREMYKRVGP